MKLDTQHLTLDALIDLFNSQAEKQDWDAAYGTSVAIAELYEERAKAIRESVVNQLKIGVVARAREAAESKAKKKR